MRTDPTRLLLAGVTGRWPGRRVVGFGSLWEDGETGGVCFPPNLAVQRRSLEWRVCAVEPPFGAAMLPGASDDKPKWSRRKEARPGEIVDAALEVFAEKGFAATNLDDIAHRAGDRKGPYLPIAPG